MNTDYRPTNSWDFRLRAAKLGELMSVRSLATLSLMVTLIALLATLATPLQAQSLHSFVDNANRSVTSDSVAFQAQSFETGANAGGYTVSKVEILLGDVSGKSTSVKIREDNGGEPGNLVGTLTNPGTLESDKFNTFTAQHVITLAESTTYWITVNEGISSDRMPVSNTSADDDNSAWGWSIGDGRLYRTSEMDTWSDSNTSLLITIKGTISADATLSGLTLEGADGGETITLSPAFDDDTETYTASVVNRIDAVKLTATKNDDNAQVVITNDDQTSSPEEAVLDLSVGSNTLTVTVTAQDGTATRTYTITVERHTADTLVSNTHLSSTESSIAFQAQSFGTGANAGGYTVSEVNIHLGFTSGSSTRVRIRKDDGGKPGDLVATLTNPASLTADSLNTFTAPAGTTLAASMTYWITVNEGISSAKPQFRYVGGNDETSETGWTIGDSRLSRGSETGNWLTFDTSLLMTIKGTAIPPTTLVSNTHLSSTGSSSGIEAQSFETGANLDGYTVSQVDIRLGDISGASTSVKIRKNNGNQPGDLVATLTNPGTLTADSLNTFTAPAGTTLAASTTYWITVNEGISSNRAQFSLVAEDDETGETGWSIGDGRLFKGNETSRWLITNSSLLIAIKGTVPCDGIWCATLQVQDLGDSHRGCGNSSTGNECTVYLSEDEFTHAMTDYSVGAARVQSDGQLQLYLNRNITTDSQSLVLHVGSETFAFKDANVKGSDHRKWNGSGLSWTTGDTIGLKLTDAANATGNPTISGVPQVGKELTAGTSAIDDVDGLPATFTHQWVRIAPDSTETNVGTDSTTYTVSSSDVDSTIRVDVSFTDLAGNSEGPLPSEATAAVVPAAGLCPAGNDWCATMTVEKYETRATSYGFSEDFFGQLDETTIDYGPSFEVEEIYIYEPEGFSQDLIYVTFDPYVPLGTVFNLGGTNFTADAGSSDSVNIHTWVRPADFAWIVGQEVRVSANLAPAPESATVDGTSLVLTHSEDLDRTSVPAASAYTVKVDGDAGTNPSTVSVGTRTVTLTLATAVTRVQVVTVSYDVPTSNRLQDVSGLEAPDLNNFTVTNNTETGNSAPTFTDGETTSRSFDETIGDATATTATNIGEPVAAMDLDTGDTLTYTLEGTDSVKFDIDDATGQIKTRAGQAYDYEVARIYGFTVAVEDGEGGSDTISVTLDVNNHNEPPLAPTITDVSATSGSTTSLDVSWTAPNNVGRPVILHYDLQYRQGTSGNWTNGPQDVPITSAPIGSLTPGTSYLVQVRATNADYDDGLWSNSLGGTTNEPGNSAPTFTDGTTAIRTFEETFGDAAVATATNIDEPVSATDVNGDTLTYTLEGQDAGKFDIVSTSGQLRTKVGTKYDYEQNRTYSVTVVVEDSDDNSAEIMVVLSVIDQNEPPLAPTPVFVSPTSGSASKLNVSWHPPTNTGRPSINNYDLQYREVGAANYRNGPQNVSGTRTTISGLRPGTVYQVQVRATNPEGDGVWSPAVERSTSQNSEPDPPAVTYGLRATGVSQTRIDLSWNAPTDDGGASITDYRIEVSDDGGSTWSDLVANTGNSNRTYAHTGVAAGVTRHYRVSAINRVGTGLASAVASGQTQAASAKPKRPSTMYLYFTVSNSDWNESEEVKYSGNRIDGDCSGEKFFRAFWTEPILPPSTSGKCRLRLLTGPAAQAHRCATAEAIVNIPSSSAALNLRLGQARAVT